MTAAVSRHPSLVVFIDGEPFYLAQNEEGAPIWQPQRIPTQEGDPVQPRRRRVNDWSRGMGDSRGAFRGAVEYAENAYLGAMGRLLPGPKIHEIETDLGGTVYGLVEVDKPASRILAGGGSKIAAINPSDHAFTIEKTFSSGTVVSMCRYYDMVAVALGDDVDYQVRDEQGTYVENQIGKKARCFGLVNGDLARGYRNTRSLISAQDLITVDHWSLEMDIGDPVGMVNQIFSHNRWEYVLKDEGLYSFDEETSEEANLLTDLESFASPNNRYVFKWYDHVYVCTQGGLYRYIQQGAARTVGIEEMDLNESELQNAIPTAGVAYGRQIIVAFWDGTNTYIVQGRRSREGDAGFGSPITWLSVLDKFAGECRAMMISSRSGETRVYYGAGGNVRHFGLTLDGRPLEFRDTGTVKVWLAPTDFESAATLKTFTGVEMVGRNLSETRKVQFKARMDDGEAHDVGDPITSLTNTYAEAYWTLGTNDSGRVMQLGVELTLDGEAVPEIREIFVAFEERPLMVAGAVFGLRFRDYFQVGEISSRLTASEQRELVESYVGGEPVEVIDPWGRHFWARISHYDGQPLYQYRGEEPQLDMALTIREINYG
jgi:hypothetical protein